MKYQHTTYLVKISLRLRFRRKVKPCRCFLRELHWIKELGTASTSDCNDQIKGVGTLSSPSCRNTNVLGIFPGGYFQIRRLGGLGPHIKFGGKIWGKVRPSSPNKRKNLGSSVTTRRKSWEKVPILGSYLKFRGQNLRYLSLIFLEAKFGASTRISGANFGPSPLPRPPNMEVPPGGIFNKQQQQKRSHEHRHYNKRTPQLDSSIDSYVNLIDSIGQPQGVHKIKTMLFFVFLPKLRELQSLAQESINYAYESAEYRVTAFILDTAQYKLFRPVCSDLLSTDAKTHFIKLNFINKGIDTVNLPSILILRSKSVTETVPTYFKEKNHQ